VQAVEFCCLLLSWPSFCTTEVWLLLIRVYFNWQEYQQNFYRIKDFVSDLLVLCLTSSETIEKILQIKGEDAFAAIASTLPLIFGQCHLFAVNSKDDLPATQRVSMFWSSMLWFTSRMEAPRFLLLLTHQRSGR